MTKPSIRTLAWVVGRDVNRTFGGGNAAMELIRRTFSHAGWLDAANHGLLVAVSRLTPGTNILAYCAALGWQMHGTAGGAAALLAGSIPTAALVTLISATLVQIDRYRSVQVVLALGSLIAAWLVFAAAWHLIRPYLTDGNRAFALVVAAVATTLILLDITPVRTLLVCAAAGALWRRPVPPSSAA